jgi:large subunit ribosomal protein L19
MENQIAEFTLPNKKTTLPVIKAGDTVRVYQKYKDKDKDKIQMFEGLVMCRKHGNETGAAITVRKIASGVGVEKIFPLHSPIVDHIEVIKIGKVRRAKVYYMRTAKGKRSRIKRIEAKTPAAKEETKKQEV